jgi:hypothetical protein
MSPRSPAGGAIFHVLSEFSCATSFDVDHKPEDDGEKDTYAEISRMKAGQREAKAQRNRP